MSAYDPATLPADSPQPRQEQYNGNFGETYTLPIRAYSCPRDTGQLASWRPQGTSASPSPCALSHQQHRQMPLPVYAFWRQAIHSAPNLATHSGHLHSIFYLSAMLPTFASDFAQSLGPTAGGEDPAITIFAGERMDGHDSSRWVRRITTILKARTIPVKVQDTSLFTIVRRSIMSINSALRLSATFIALVVCFDVKTTTPPMTAAIAPIIAAASNQTAPSK